MQANDKKVLQVANVVKDQPAYFFIKVNEESGWEPAKIEINQRGLHLDAIGPLSIFCSGDAQLYLVQHITDIVTKKIIYNAPAAKF